MLNYLKDHKGSIEVNGVSYRSVQDAIGALQNSEGQLVVVLNKTSEDARTAPERAVESQEESPLLKIKVKAYMTKPASPEFDFMDKWNNGIPMPLRIMVGRKLKETKGMIQMELWGAITEEVNQVCMKCGKTLTNPVSRYFGIGPECGGHNYTNPFASDEDLSAAIAGVQEQLKKTTWTGWIIKSAIEEIGYVNEEVR